MLIVQKFGGTSVADLDRIKNVVNIITTEINKGNKVIIVVSAMAKVTNNLVSLVQDNFETTSDETAAEYDSILSTGEQVSSALLALMLQKAGLKARSWLGWQLPIISDKNYTKSRITNIDKSILQKILDRDEIPVVAGFQAVNDDNRITTIGRGGSDTTATAIAAAIAADRCDIYTDVEGVYTADPRVVKSARKLDKISYEEMLELASLGAKVLQTRSVEIAMRYNVPVKVLSSFNADSGTMLIKENKTMEKRLITAITYSSDEARITLSGIPIENGAVSVFEYMDDINVDMIVQNTNHDGTKIDLTFTVPKLELEKVVSRIEKKKTMINYQNMDYEKNVSKISVVGVGMKSHSGVAKDMFKALASKSIGIKAISTSEIKISVLIPEEYTELAVRTLHAIFDLEK
jgi:aspartate kinase